MSQDHMDTTTPGYAAFHASRMHYTEGSISTEIAFNQWQSMSQNQRNGWHAVAEAASAEVDKRLGGQIAQLSEAICAMTHGHETVTLDYTNANGVRGERHVRPLSVYYGTTDWHREPGLLMPCWDLDRGAFRIYSLEPESLHAWNNTPVEAKGDRARTAALEEENLTLRKELAKMGERYASAVQGPAQFREAFRALREAIQQAEARFDPDFAEVPPSVSVVEGKRTFSTDEICRIMDLPNASTASAARTNRALVMSIHEAKTVATFSTASRVFNGVVESLSDLPDGDTEFRVVLKDPPYGQRTVVTVCVSEIHTISFP